LQILKAYPALQRLGGIGVNLRPLDLALDGENDGNCAFTLVKLKQLGLDIFGKHEVSFTFQEGLTGSVISKTNGKEVRRYVRATQPGAHSRRTLFALVLCHVCFGAKSSCGNVEVEVTSSQCISYWCCTLLSSALLIALLREKRRNQQLTSKLECLMEVPRVAKAPPGMSQQDLQSVMDLAWEYSLNGIEGNRAGHILAIGPAVKLLERGNCRGTNHFQLGPPRFISKHVDDIKIEMNFDGAHVLDGTDGRIVATRFFAHSSPHANSGGAGEACAKGLSSVPGSVIFKISADGAIKEFRDGSMFRKHAGSKPQRNV